MSAETTKGDAAPLEPHKAVRYNLSSRSNESKTAPIIDYIDDIEQFLTAQNLQNKPDEVVHELNRLHRGFKIHQQSLHDDRAELQRRLPGLKDNLKLIRALQQQETTKIRFLAADSLWVDGVVQKSDTPTVGLWLGANVMMEFTYDEAEKLLSENIENSEKMIERQTKDLVFLKEQITTCEVTTSRFYNYGVALNAKKRKSEQEALASKQSGKA